MSFDRQRLRARRRGCIAVGALAIISLSLGCAGRRQSPKSTAVITKTEPLRPCPGDSAAVVSATPRTERADRDLDADGNFEPVMVDRELCTPAGNCSWNIFVRDLRADCHRFVGAIAARAIAILGERGESGFHDLRGLWQLSGSGRLLLQRYRFVRGAYQLVEALLCAESDVDRLLCADEHM